MPAWLLDNNSRWSINGRIECLSVHRFVLRF
jgi:hypothetical protein